MKFLVIGGGMQGRACAFDLLKNPKTEEVLLADASERSLAQAKKFLADKRVKTARADAGNPAQVKKLMAGRAATVSCVPYFLNLALAKAAVAAKSHFVDLGGNTDIVRQELKLDAQAKRSGVCVLPDNGLGPGMISTIAVHGMNRLDTVDEVLIRDGGLPQKPVPPMNYMLTFSEHGLVNEYAGTATALRDGKRVILPACSELEAIDTPWGRLECGHAAGGLSTMAWTYEGKVRTMDNKFIRYPGHIPTVVAMNAMGFFSETPVEVEGKKISPRALAVKLFKEHFSRPGDEDMVFIRVIVRGEKGGRRVELVYEMTDYYDRAAHMTAMTRTTGFPAAIVAQMAAAGRIKPGAHTVEEGVPAQAFLDEMAQRGFKLSSSSRVLDAALPV